MVFPVVSIFKECNWSIATTIHNQSHASFNVNHNGITADIVKYALLWKIGKTTLFRSHPLKNNKCFSSLCDPLYELLVFF